jgi:hypothetical protein
VYHCCVSIILYPNSIIKICFVNNNISCQKEGLRVKWGPKGKVTLWFSIISFTWKPKSYICIFLLLFLSYYCLCNVVVKIYFWWKRDSTIQARGQKRSNWFSQTEKTSTQKNCKKKKKVVFEVGFFPCLQHGAYLALSILHSSKQVASKFYKAYQI